MSRSNRAADSTKKSDYEKLEKSADQTEASADRLVASGSENVTAADLQSFVDKYNEMLKNLGKSSDTLNLFYAQTAKDTVKEYRQELSEIGIAMAKDGTLRFDKSQFEKFRAEQSAKAAAGAEPTQENTTAGTGTETIQENTAAGTEAAQENAAGTAEGAQPGTDADAAAALAAKLNALFSKEGGFFSKLSFLASRVYDYADANAESYSGSYNAAGSRTNAYSDGKYNFWS